MIALTSCRTFDVDGVPSDVIERRHRYKVYTMSPKKLICKFYNYSTLMKFLMNHDFKSNVYVELQYLGHDGFFYTFRKNYYSFISNQLSLL